MLYAIIIFIELIFIWKQRSTITALRKIKITSPCGNCIREAAYERLQERKRIIALANKIYPDNPEYLHTNIRKRSIAESACKYFYLQLKNKLEQI